MLDLRSKEDTMIAGIFPTIAETIVRVKLLRVEDYGIWIESEDFNGKALRSLGVTQAPNSMAVFLPWQQVRLVIDSLPPLSQTVRR